MYTNDLSDLMRTALKKKPEPKPVLDAAVNEPTLDGADSYTESDIKLKAVTAIQQWTETDDLEDGESMADRLLALFVGIVDINKDGELDDDEQSVLEMALNAAWDYLTELGAADEDAGALLNDWDSDAADRIRDLVASVLPDGDMAMDSVNSFVFAAQEPVLDAVYKKKVVIRAGKKVRINKRISGKVRLSARQKVAIRKAGLKSHSAAAQMHRMKSMRLRKRSGLK